ncbi:MAG: type 4a pilus biogenesis protein PilO [Patescibacteria group bacterium]
MKPINQKQKNILALVVFLSCSLMMIGFVAYPYYLKISEKNSEIYDQRIQLTILEQQRLNTEQTHQDYNKIKNDFNTVGKIFIDPNDMLSFISKLETIANNNIITQNISISSSTKVLENNSLPFSLTLEGTWPHISQYIRDIEAMDIYVSINSISISSNNNIIVAQLSANVYPQTK